MTVNIVRSTRVPLPAWAVPDRVKAKTHAALSGVLESEAPDVLALQEIDRATLRHLRFGATRVADPSLHGSLLASDGTVIDLATGRFHAQGFFRDKGWSAATVTVAGFHRPVRVVAIHLDAFSKRIRAQQIDELCAVLSDFEGPLVVLGDLNEDDVPFGAVSMLCERLALSARRDRPTYDCAGISRTLDWILISRELVFSSYDVLPERLSDHRAVVATLREAKTGNK
jgi:endonuclease/exonuclease/phosphatase family metal-dependent hydrolase